MIKRPRQKDEQHLDFIRSLPCAVCGNNIETEAAHVRYGSRAYGKRPTGIGEKPSDVWTVPLCNTHHRDQHDMNEQDFWSQHGIGPLHLACKLYAISGDYDAGVLIIGKTALNK